MEKNSFGIKFLFCFILLLSFTCIISYSRFLRQSTRRNDSNGIKHINDGQRSENSKTPGVINNIFEVKLKPGLMKLINPKTPKYALTVNASYHLENKDLCSSERNLTFLIIILSGPKHFERRNVIRETWGNSSFYAKYGTVKIMFVLGRTNDTYEQYEIVEESKHNGDILQGNLIDSYHNLSHKTVMAYKWLTERCRNAKYIIKTDDDVVVNMFCVFKNGLKNVSIDQKHVHCYRLKSVRIMREKSRKPYIEPHQLRGKTFHWPFCQGNYVMFINSIVPSLYKSASITPLFWVDDIFNYGVVMNNIPALKYKEVLPNEHGSYQKFKGNGCLGKKSPTCCPLFIGVSNADQTRDIWFSLTGRNKNI